MREHMMITCVAFKHLGNTTNDSQDEWARQRQSNAAGWRKTTFPEDTY